MPSSYFPQYNHQQQKRRFATFIGSGFSDKQRQEDYLKSIPICKACGNTQMQKLDYERCWICVSCGRRIPVGNPSSVSNTTTTTGATQKIEESAISSKSLHVVGTSRKGGRSDKPIFAQPKDQSVRSWRKRQQDKKQHLTSEDRQLMESNPGIRIISSTEVKPRDTNVKNPQDAP